MVLEYNVAAVLLSQFPRLFDTISPNCTCRERSDLIQYAMNGPIARLYSFTPSQLKSH